MAQIRYVQSDFSQTALEKAILSNWNSLMNKFSKTPTFQRIETPAQTIMISGSSIPMLNRVIRTRLNEENVDQNINKTIAKQIKVIGILDMLIEGSRIKLRQYKHPFNARIQAIGNWNIDQAVFPSDRNGRFGSVCGQWSQSRSCSSSKN